MVSAIRCSDLSLVALAELFAAGFAGYSVPLNVTAESLAARVRREGIDLHRSVALLDEDRPIGLALLALRGRRCWVGGFAIVESHRGRGLAHLLWDAMLVHVEVPLSLEVLATNEVAHRFYLDKGMQQVRDLIIGRHETSAAPPQEQDAEWLVLHGQRRWRPAWQREIPALLSLPNLRAFGDVETWVVIDDAGTIVDTGAASLESAKALLGTLPGPLRLVNEPEESPYAQIVVETGRQHELILER